MTRPGSDCGQRGTDSPGAESLNPDAQIILVGYYNPRPSCPPTARHFRLLNRSVKALAQQYGADYVSIPYTSIANDGHPTVCGHKYIARQILKAVRKLNVSFFQGPACPAGSFLLSCVYFRHSASKASVLTTFSCDFPRFVN